LEIQQTAIRQLTTEQEAMAAASTMAATQGTKGATSQTTVTVADADDSEFEAENKGAADTKTDAPKQTGSPVTSTSDGKKGKVSCIRLLYLVLLEM
jgi:hypothetical protein